MLPILVLLTAALAWAECLEEPLTALQKLKRSRTAVVASVASVAGHGLLLHSLDEEVWFRGKINEQPGDPKAPDWRLVGKTVLDHPESPFLGWTILSAHLQGVEKRKRRAILRDYDRLVEGLKSLEAKVKDLSVDKQVRAIRKLFIDSGMRRYCKEMPKLTYFFTKFCGNCVAQSELMVAALTDANFEFPQGWELGVQKFTRHVRPVLYNREEDQAIDLVWEFRDRIVDPTFDPRALLVPLLMKTGQREVRPGLLLSPGKEGKRGRAFNLTVKMRDFSTGPVPARAIVPLEPRGPVVLGTESKPSVSGLVIEGKRFHARPNSIGFLLVPNGPVLEAYIEDEAELRNFELMDQGGKFQWIQEKLLEVTQGFRTSGELAAMKQYLEHGVLPEDHSRLLRWVSLRELWRVGGKAIRRYFAKEVGKESILLDLNALDKNPNAEEQLIPQLRKLDPRATMGWVHLQDEFMGTEEFDEILKQYDLRPEWERPKGMKKPRSEITYVVSFEPRDSGRVPPQGEPEGREKEVIYLPAKVLLDLDVHTRFSVKWDEAMYQYVESLVGTPDDYSDRFGSFSFPSTRDDYFPIGENPKAVPRRIAQILSQKDPSRQWARSCFVFNVKLDAFVPDAECDPEDPLFSHKK